MQRVKRSSSSSSLVVAALVGVLAAAPSQCPGSVPEIPANAPEVPETPPGSSPVAAVAALANDDQPVGRQREAIYDEKVDAKEQIAAALEKARKENRRVLVQWGANWCGWCHLLHDTFRTDREIARELLYEYDVVLVDIGQWDRHMDLAASYGADLKGSGVPFITILDAETGKAIVNQETGALELKDSEEPAHDPAKVLSLLKQHETTPMRADAALADALEQGKREGKHVFVHFGAPWCGWCHQLEGWMAQPEIEKILAKRFVLRKIDAERMTGGKELLEKYSNGQSAGIPWFAIVDAETGETIITSAPAPSDTPGMGNIGYPVAEAETAHFRKMLTAGAQTLNEADVDTLIASLQKRGREIIEARKVSE